MKRVGLALLLVWLSYALVVATPVIATADDAAPPAVTSAADLATLNVVSIQPGDLRGGFEILPYPDGSSVQGFVSLDVCGADFPSEALRTGRSQVSVVPKYDPTFSQTIFAVEALMYRDDQASAQAMTELIAAANDCPTSSFVQSPSCTCHGGDEGEENWQFHAPPDRGWKRTPGTQRVAFAVVISDRHGNSTQEHLIYQRHGRLVVAIYASPEEIAYTVPGRARAEQRLVNAIAARLATTRTT